VVFVNPFDAKQKLSMHEILWPLLEFSQEIWKLAPGSENQAAKERMAISKNISSSVSSISFWASISFYALASPSASLVLAKLCGLPKSLASGTAPFGINHLLAIFTAPGSL
jgi:hypothetical protein